MNVDEIVQKYKAFTIENHVVKYLLYRIHCSFKIYQQLSSKVN